MTAGLLLLAAGNSRRFGRDKRAATLASGATLLDTTLANCLDSGLPLRVCLGVKDRALIAALESRGVELVVCPRSEHGMGATLADAAAGLKGWSAVLVALGDMPWIRPATIAAIADCATPDSICVPQFDGSPGHPVAFGADFFGLLSQCAGDHGARWVIERHPGAVVSLPVDDPGILADVDTPEALRQR